MAIQIFYLDNIGGNNIGNNIGNNSGSNNGINIGSVAKVAFCYLQYSSIVCSPVKSQACLGLVASLKKGFRIATLNCKGINALGMGAYHPPITTHQLQNE